MSAGLAKALPFLSPPEMPDPRPAPPLQTLLATGLLAVCYYIAARAGLLLAFNHSNATPVWPPSGIAFGAMLLAGYRVWPGILLGAFAANLATFEANGLPPDARIVVVSALIAAGNTLEALSGAWLMRRFLRGPALEELHAVYKFTGVAMLMCVVSAGIGSVTLMVSGLIPASAYWTVVATWWVGDTAGVLVVAPAIVAWSPLRKLSWRPRVVLEAALSLAALAALIWLTFSQRYSPDGGTRWMAYLFVLAIGWASHRYALRGASLVCLLTAGGAVMGTTHGLGPFAAGTLNDALISLESFVVLCAVIGMILCADANERHRMQGLRSEAIAAQWLTLFAGIGLTVLVWHLVSVSTERRAREQFAADCANISQRIAKRIELYETGLRSAQALFRALPVVDRMQWREFVNGIDIARNFPGIQGLGYGQYVPLGQRAALEQAMHAEGFPQFHVWPKSDAPATVVRYLEPFSGRNLRAFGYDMQSDPVRREAILRAARMGQPALSDKVTLVQETGVDVQPGFLLYMPIYRKDAPIATPAQRLAALQGFAYAPLRSADMMRGILGADDHAVQLAIFDGDSSDPAARLYSSAERTATEANQYPNPFMLSVPLDLANHRWTLRFTSLAAFEDQIDRQKSHIVLLAGTIISLLFFGVVRALTARHAYAQTLANEMTEALRDSESSLILARDQAEAASRAKTEFVANMSHEIRTPLNAVLGMTHLLSNTALSADQQKYLEMIRLSGNSLLSILNDVLDFSKIEAGRMDLSPAPFQLSAVLEAVATIMSVNSGEKDLELAIGVEPDVPQSLIGDAHRLQQILINLAGNAIKFTETGYVYVLVQLATLPPAPGASVPVQLRFTVRDSGIGIAPELQAQLFAPFSQADASMTRRFGGTGLGLAISRRIAALMGGAIEVSSVPGRGSSFTLTVTLKACGESSAAQAQAPLAVHRLLVVDDDDISASYLCKTIRTRRWEAERVASGAEALERLRQPDAHFDAALVDWSMPGMNGVEAVLAMRATPLGANLPILLMVSAFGQGKLLHVDGAQAADAVLLKPVTVARLAEGVQLAASTRQARAAQAHGGAVHATANAATSDATSDATNDATAASPAAPPMPSAPIAPPAAQGLRIDGARLLLVEDNPINQLVAKSMLTFAGASIDAVDNGRAAVDLLQTEAHRYDLVLMDVQMPEMDGFEATRRIRQDLKLLDLPVLAMTAGVLHSEREQCIACGMNDFIAKPIDVDEMLQAIARNLPSR